MQSGFYVDLGQMDYEEALSFQEYVYRRRVCGALLDTLILVEHPPVFTIGRSGGYEHLIGEIEDFKLSGIKVIEVDRGGSITFHGYGQIVAYPIVHTERFNGNLLRYLRLLEELIIKVLSEFDICAKRYSPYTGVWVGNEKIAAIGVACRNSVTSHGFALNVSTDLSYFSMINPCGIVDYGVTSMEHILPYTPLISSVKKSIQEAYAYIFEGMLTPIEPEEIGFNPVGNLN
jgi:lipoyl(octanoyl) transferase